MTDRQKEDQYLRARKLAYSIQGGRLDRIRNGSEVLKNIYDYSRLMREHGFNPDSKEHCMLVAETLEQRLEQEKSTEMIAVNKDNLPSRLQENGILVYSTTGMSGVDHELYNRECKRIESELKEIFKEFYHSGIFAYEWEEDIFNEPNSRYHLRIKSGEQKLNINQVFQSNNTCSHGFMDIKIKVHGIFRPKPIVDGYTCFHIRGMAIDDYKFFKHDARDAYSFYTKRSKMPNGDERLNYYFSFFRLLPEMLKQVCIKKVNMLP